jgi:acyl-coenzyme A synthetase/AMP-(fatty) acid ligase
MFLTEKIPLDKIAIISETGKQITYSELEEFSSEIKNILCHEKCLTIILCDNTIETLRIYYALLSCQVVPLLLDNKINISLILNIVKKYRPKYLWIKSSFIQYFNDYYTVFSEGEYLLIKSHYELFPINPELSLLLSTSGSTGNPKFVKLSYKNIYSNTLSAVETLEITSESRLIVTLPMNYAYGLSLIHIHFFVGATILITQKSVIDNGFWQFYTKEKPTFIAGVPQTYSYLDKLGFFDMKQSDLQHVIFSGGYADVNIQQKLSEGQQKNNYKVHIMYGQTETTWISELPPNLISVKYGSVGLPIKHTKSTLGDNGELILESDSVFMGYALNYKDLSLPNQINNILHTGDMVYLDEDNCIYLKGRINRYCKLAGIRINLDDVEILIKKHFKDIDVACIDEENTMPVLYKGSYAKEDIKKIVSEAINIYKGMICPIQVDEIPRNERGKIQYAELKSLWCNLVTNFQKKS